MKVRSLLFGMFLLAGTANAFAGTNAKAADAKGLGKTETAKTTEFKIANKNLVKQTGCTVSASWTNSDGTKSSVSITVTCDCTQQAACDAAYKIASIAIP